LFGRRTARTTPAQRQHNDWRHNDEPLMGLQAHHRRNDEPLMVLQAHQGFIDALATRLAFDALELRGQVRLERLADRCHVVGVDQILADQTV